MTVTTGPGTAPPNTHTTLHHQEMEGDKVWDTSAVLFSPVDVMTNTWYEFRQ